MLRRAIASCTKQTIQCECIVVDDASTDETPAVVSEFPEVRYLRNPIARGHSAAANAGIRAAGGEWIKPLDDDDWLAPDCIEIFSRALQSASECGFAATSISGVAMQVDQNGRESGPARSPVTTPSAVRSRDLLALMMLDEAPLGTPVQVGHSRKAALAAGGWNERRPFAHQHGDEAEFWIKLAGLGDAVFVPDVVAYRQNWIGGSQRSIAHWERYRSNLHLKQEIASALHRPVPESIQSYLALHWALVSAKELDLGTAMRLSLQWMKNPESAAHLLERHSFRHAREHFHPLTMEPRPNRTR